MDEATFHALSHADFRTRLPAVTSATIDDPATAARVANDLRDLLDSWTDADIDSVREAIAAVGAQRSSMKFAFQGPIPVI